MATIEQTTIERPDVAADHAAKQNAAIFPNVISHIDHRFGVPETAIYLYNVSRQEFNCPRPPNHPHMLLRARKEDEEYALVGQITHPFREIEYDQNGAQVVRMTDGYREATRMLSPMNPGTDQEFDAPDAFNVGGNLNLYGCFWSVHNPPLDEELAAARRRMEKTYRLELEKLAAIEAKNPENARALANDISHAAAAYYGVSTSWHRSDLIPHSAGKVDCFVCGEKIQAAAQLCVHCGAPTDPELQAGWLAKRVGAVEATIEADDGPATSRRRR